VPLFTSGGLGLGLVIFGLGLKNLVLFTLLIVIGVDYVRSTAAPIYISRECTV